MAVTSLSRDRLASDAGAAHRRQVMIDSQLRPSDVTDPRVIAAIAAVDREMFVSAERRAMAYADRAVPLVPGRALNPVVTTARLLVDLAPAQGDRILLIGAATGYAAALLAAMGATVTAVESDAALAAMARVALADHSGVTLVEAPMTDPVVNETAFDAMMIDGCVEQLPPAMLAPLRDGARIVSGLADGAVTRLGRAVYVPGTQTVALVPFADIECVRLPGFAAPRPFQF